jgi:serine protease Do
MKKLIFILILCGCAVFGTSPAFSKTETADKPEVLSDLQEAFVRVADIIEPVVVNIASTRIEKTQSYSSQFGSPFGDEDPFNDFFKHFFPSEPGTRKIQSLGSGIIIDKRGYVLTNYHVVEKATDIQVTLGDGNSKKTYSAKIMGSDSRTDLAIIRVENKKGEEFPVAPLGDSDKIRIGEWAIAIGSPFGLEHTLTVGVISAKRQNVSIQNNNYEDFIQTDASINPGNSGGPLVNIRGEVVGVNTAIYSPSGGFVGVGFAIPINKAKEILTSLIENGKVVRGWLGVRIQDITDELAKSFNLTGKDGALVNEVVAAGPAEKAGIKRGDVIVEIDGKPVKTTSELRSIVGRISPDKKTKVKVMRGGKEVMLGVVLGKAPEDGGEALSKDEATNDSLGLTVQNSKDGVVVTKVEPGSLAQSAGIREGDLIKEANNKEIKDVPDFENAAKEAKETMLFLIKRGDITIYTAIGLK